MEDGLDEGAIEWLDVDGVRTRCYHAGTGEPLVLLHGGEFGAIYSLGDWSLNLPGFARQFEVYAPDRIGQGHTDNPGAGGFTLEAVLDHTRRFFDAAGIRRAHVVGHSRGALLACALAQREPELFRSLVIVDSRSTAPPNPAHRNQVLRENTEIRSRLRAGEPTAATVRAEADVQSFRPAGITAEFVDRMLEIARLPKTMEAQREVESVRQSTWGPSLSRLRLDVLAGIEARGLAVPVLLVWGFNDRSAPVEMGLELFGQIAARTRTVELHILNQARHYCFRDQPEAFNRAVAGFCAAVDGGGA